MLQYTRGAGLTESKPEIRSGLDGVYFMESAICKVDGANGRLYYYGYPIDELAAESNFEEVSYLLMNGRLPNLSELSSFRERMRAARAIPGEVIDVITELSERSTPMHILSTAVDMIGSLKREGPDRKSTYIEIISELSSVVAAIGSISATGRYTRPEDSLGHIENFLYMLKGERPNKESVEIMERMFILHAEHSSNASTFSAIVTASTLSDIYSSTVSAINTLKGPLHGGADEMALRMLNDMRGKDIARYVDNTIASGGRIMGFGHRVYKSYDPRATIIKGILESVQPKASAEVRELTKTVLSLEAVMRDKVSSKGIWPNVDLFTGPVYRYLDILPELFTPIFAASRAPGWCSHIQEYWKSNKLLRPTVFYTGEVGKRYVPIEKRQGE